MLLVTAARQQQGVTRQPYGVGWVPCDGCSRRTAAPEYCGIRAAAVGQLGCVKLQV
jgi:hypothetical protein